MTVFLDPVRRALLLVHQPGMGGFKPFIHGEVVVDEIDGEGRLSRTCICRGCGARRTFWAATEKLLGQQIASAGWKPDGPKIECPKCWLTYEGSVLRAARGNT